MLLWPATIPPCARACTCSCAHLVGLSGTSFTTLLFCLPLFLGVRSRSSLADEPSEGLRLCSELLPAVAFFLGEVRHVGDVYCWLAPYRDMLDTGARTRFGHVSRSALRRICCEP